MNSDWNLASIPVNIRDTICVARGSFESSLGCVGILRS